MSYTATVKDEVFQKHSENPTENLYEIYGILKIKNAIKPDCIEFNIENSALAKRVYQYFKDNTDFRIIVKYSVSKKLGEHRVYSVIIPFQKNFKNLVNTLTKIDNEKGIRNENRIKGYIRGVFLCCGYIKSPEKDYSLEYVIDDRRDAVKLYETFRKMGKRVSIKEKLPKYLIYIKNSEDIMDILVMVGAMKAFFQYEEVTMIKEIKNKTIRSMNWEVANETKVIDTAERQIDMIEYLEIEMGLENLSEVLQEVCLLRLENQDSSLNELADMIGITKSGIRNRFRRIEKIYTELKENSEKPKKK